MKNATEIKKASDIIRSSWDWKGAKTQSFIINGKKITTNLCSEWGYYNGWDIPEKYTYKLGGKCYKSRHCSADELDELVAQGFDEIRFKLYASKMIRGYCETYVYASKSAVAKEMRKKLRAEAEAKRIEEAKAELSKNLSAQLKADAEKKAEREAQAQAEAIQRGAIINPDKNYHVVCWKIGAPVEEKTDCGIWKGDGMAHFSEGFGVFTYSADGWLYFAQEAQEEPEKADETAQEDDAFIVNTSKRLEISREKINEWNDHFESTKGTSKYYDFTLWHEGRDEHGKWFDLGNRSGINEYHVDHPSDHYFIKKIKENTWLYFEDCGGIEERWLLSDQAIAFFIKNEPLEQISKEEPQSSAEGSPVKEEEIIQPETANATESNSEAQMSMIEIANTNNLTEFYNLETDSIRFPDNYFVNTEIFVFRMLRENPDLIMSTEYDFQNARWIHLENRSQPEKAQEELQSSDDEITQGTSADATEGNSEALNDYAKAFFIKEEA